MAQETVKKSVQALSEKLSRERKVRSNSLADDLEEQNKSGNKEENSDADTERYDFHKIIKHFESKNITESVRARLTNKRPSVQVVYTRRPSASPATHTSSLLPKNTVTKHQSVPQEVSKVSIGLVKPSQLSKPKTRLCPSQSNGSDAPIQYPHHSVVQNELHNEPPSCIDEHDSVSTASRESIESSTPFTSSIQGEWTSVQMKREFFNRVPHLHFYRSTTSDDQPQPKQNLSSSQSTSSIHAPPPIPSRSGLSAKSHSSDLCPVSTHSNVDKTAGESSTLSLVNSSQEYQSDVSFSDEEIDYEAERKIKLRRCLDETFETEKTYVHILYVLAVKLSAEIKNVCDKDDNLILTFNNAYRPLLGTIQPIYQLHQGIILPEMQEYINGHRTGTMWSVLEKHFKIIEVLYKNYYVKYYDTQEQLDDLCKSQPLINEAMIKCQSLLNNLYPIAQLNCPNQRLLRYILLLKTYMKYLDQQSDEYKHILSIHDELDRIAGRCEEELVISAAQLSELKERLDNTKFECIKEHRKLLWHGPVKKISPRRHGDIAQRYMILFSDCILVCSEESGHKLDIKRELSLKDITIDIQENNRSSLMPNSDQPNGGITYYSFRVNAVEKSYEFLVEKESDRALWVKKILWASDEYNKRTFVVEVRESYSRSDEQLYGTRAPVWVNDVDVSRCQNCNNRFRARIILSRRHHCRSCGRCVCGSCSTKKTVLEYCKSDGDVRVCDLCYTHITKIVLCKNTGIWPKPTRQVDETILFGDFRAVNSGSYVWIALQEDYRLHVYGAKLDQAEDYAISLPDLIDLHLDPDTRIFTLREPSKNHILAIDFNHQIIYKKNDILEEKLKNSENRITFYTNLWHEAIQLARSTTIPAWYIRKRDSSDSGVSSVN